MKLRVMVAEEDRPFLRTVVSVLESECEIVAIALDAESAVRFARELHPNVVVLDLEISRRKGIEVTTRISQPTDAPAVVVCSLETDPDIVQASRNAGALGYVLKSRIATDLLAAVRSAANGRPFLSPT